MKKVDDLYDKLDEELTVSLDAAEFYSISYQKELLKNEFIPAFEKKIHDMEKNYKKICKDLAKDCDFNKKFQVNGQASKISKILRDNRSWKEKARETGLENEYQFIYEYTSSLLHCTSFSIRTKPTLEKQERIMRKA